MKLKKSYIIIGGALLLLVIVLLLINTVRLNGTDGAKFKKEYEALNGEKAYGDYKYQKLKIDKKNKIKYINMEEAYDIIESRTGLIYFGYPKCPWCRGMLPSLLKTVDCSCLENIYYVDMTDKRDEYEVKDDRAVLKKEASQEYYDLLELLDKHLMDYTVTDDDGIEYETGEKRIYVPFVVAVNNGVIRDVYDGIDIDENQSPFDELTSTQKSELEVIFENLIASVTESNNNEEKNVCDEHC